jgi:hypothetical protein
MINLDSKLTFNDLNKLEFSTFITSRKAYVDFHYIP